MSTPPSLLLPERYEPQHELARGGMGAVWRVTDLHFQRPLAVKVMLPQTAANPEAVARFEREAELTGTLQHPAIPPVVDRGTLPDGKPFFSLKLVEGQTLSALLKHRQSPQEDLPRFLGIFEQVCQAVGYAHFERIIHRDLKPSNVMVGAFGEVQVMDWGMARRLGSGAPSASSAPSSAAESYGEPFDPETATVLFSEDGSGLTAETEDLAESHTITVGGQVMGTLSYLSPEQARGNQQEVNTQADVFALGGILCKILIGQAPYTGTDPAELFQRALLCELTAVFAQLEACGVDNELVELAKQCLSRDPADRPENAFAVAEVIQQYEEETRKRLQEEKVERAAAVARATEEKKRRKVTLIAASLAVLLLSGTGFAGWWYQKEETARVNREATEKARIAQEQADEKARIAREQAEQQARETQARKDILDALQRTKELRESYQFNASAALLLQAENRLTLLDDPAELTTRIKQARKELAMVQELDRILMEKNYTHKDVLNREYGSGSQGAYATAFQKYGIDLLTGDVVARSAQIQQSPIRDSLLDGLYAWALYEKDTKVSNRVWGLIESVQTPEQNRLRKKIDRSKKVPGPVLRELIRDRQFSSYFALVLANALKKAGHGEIGADLLRAASNQSPGNFWLHIEIGNFEVIGSKGKYIDWEERLEHFRAALALRPDSTLARYEVAEILWRKQRYPEAEQAFQTLVKMTPDDHHLYFYLGESLLSLRRFDEGMAALLKMVELSGETEPARWNAYEFLCWSLVDRKAYRRAEQCLQLAMNVYPEDVYFRRLLSQSLQGQKRLKEAMIPLQTALSLVPKDERVFDKARMKNRINEEIAQLRKRIAEPVVAPRPDPNNQKIIPGSPEDALRQYREGMRFVEWKWYEEAVEPLQQAITITPELAEAHFELGEIYRRLNQKEKSEEYYLQAAELQKTQGKKLALAKTYNHLGRIRSAEEKFQEAENYFRLATELAPEERTYRVLWALMLKRQGKKEESLKVLRGGTALP